MFEKPLEWEYSNSTYDKINNVTNMYRVYTGNNINIVDAIREDIFDLYENIQKNLDGKPSSSSSTYRETMEYLLIGTEMSIAAESAIIANVFSELTGITSEIGIP